MRDNSNMCVMLLMMRQPPRSTRADTLFPCATHVRSILYGVPIRYSLTPGVEAGAVRLDVKQWRADARAEARFGGGFFDRVRVRAGFADYEHAEIDDTGAVGTRFFAQGFEGRVELVQADRGGWKGAIGTPLLVRDMHIVGAEKLLLRNDKHGSTKD